MRIIKLLFAICVAVSFTSCQKDFSPDDVTPPTISFKVKTYTEDVTSASGHSVTTFNLTYDASDRVTNIVSAASPGDKFVFQYSGGSYTMDLFNSSVVSIHEVFFLNSSSFVDSTFQYNDTNDSTTEKYIYNGAGQLVTLKQYEYSLVSGAILFNTEDYVYDGNGNAIQISDSNSITTYDYYASLPNNLVFGTPYLPVNKNLVKTTTTDLGGTTITLNHTYTFDANNRLSTEKIVADSGEIVIKTYTYY